MLCTFTTEQGALIISSDTIRRIEDTKEGTNIVWMEGDEAKAEWINGTALENRDRIQQEELDLIDRVNQHHLKAQAQAQLQQQLAQQPPRVERGKQAVK